MAEKAKQSPRDRRITKHVNAITEGGTDIKKFAAAIAAVRDDPALGSAHRGAIWKTLAQEAAQAFYVFTTGKPIDMDDLIKRFEESEQV